MSDDRASKFRQDYQERERNLAYYLRMDVNEAKQKVEVAGRGWITYAKEDLRFAQKERLMFWKNTFRDADPNVEDLNEQWIRLYLNWGHLFKTPTNKIIQDLLDALDDHSPTWDRDTPGDFFQTLGFNFPDLLLANPPKEEVARKRDIFPLIFQSDPESMLSRILKTELDGGSCRAASPAATPTKLTVEKNPAPEGKLPASGVFVSVDQITKPGAMISGKVAFSDGQLADWYLDQTGRLGVVPKQTGYKPSAADVQDFQLALQQEVAKLGY